MVRATWWPPATWSAKQNRHPLNVRTAVKAAGASLSDVAPLLMSRHKRSLGLGRFFREDHPNWL